MRSHWEVAMRWPKHREDVSMQQDSQDVVKPTVMERQLEAMLRVVDPLKAALVDVELSEDTLDALALERAVQALRREASSRDGRSTATLLIRVAERLERHQAR